MSHACDALIDASPAPMVCIDAEGDHTIGCANQAFARLVGRERDEVIGGSLFRVLPATRQLAPMLQRVHREQTGDTMALASLGDGDLIGSAWPISHPDEPNTLVLQLNTPSGVAEQVRESNRQLRRSARTAREEADAVERELERRNALLGGLAEGVLVLDPGGRPILINDAAQEMANRLDPDNGFDLVNDLKHALQHLRHLDGSLIDPANLPGRRLLRGERLDAEEYLVVNMDKVRRIVINGHAIRDTSGAIELAMMTFRDVTGLRELQQLRDEYVELISHDLRSPLTLVLGYARRLRNQIEAGTVPPRDLVDSAQEIEEAARHMNVMIGGLLESSQLESGRADMDFQSVDLVQLVDTAVHRAAERDERDRFIVTGPDTLPAVLDPEQIERVLTNLLSNAIKYSPPESPIRVNARYEADEAVVSVSDEGRGIAPEALALLFQRYQRIAPEHGSEGHGLGLYISRLIVEAHRGQIRAESQPGKGSTFMFQLPVTGPPEAQAPV